MSDPGSAVFSCPKCLSQFKWKPQFAGRKVTCRCGNVFEPTPEAPAVADETNDYAVTRGSVAAPPEESPPSAPSAPPPSAADPRMQDVRVRDALRDRSIPGDEEEDDNVKGGWFRNALLPHFLIGGGLAILATQISWVPADPPQLHEIKAGFVLLLLVLSVVTMMLGAAASSYVFSLNFGELRLAAPKFASIGVFAISMAIPFAHFDKDPYSVTGIALAGHAAIITYWALFAVFFRMELYELMLSVAIVIMLQTATMWVVFL